MSDWSAGQPPRGRQPQSGSYDYYRGARGGGAPTRAHHPPRPSGPPPEGPPPLPPRKKRRWGRRIAIALLVVVALLVGLVLYFDSMLQRTAALDFPGRVADTPGTNWLLVGSDSREGLDQAQREQLSAGDAGGRRTDTMMLVHLPADGGQPAVVSLPRDSYVPIPGRGRNKLNAAFSFGGPQLLAQTVENVTQVHIDHYAEIGFGGFAGLVDDVGGVDVCLDKPMNDNMADAHLPAGCQTLDGPRALSFVRARYSLAGGDFERAQNQRKLLGALVDKATSPATLLNPFRSFPMASSASKTFLVNDSDHLWDLAWLGLGLGDVAKGQGVTTTVPFGRYANTNAGSSIIWDKDKADQMFSAIAHDQPIPQNLITQMPGG